MKVKNVMQDSVYVHVCVCVCACVYVCASMEVGECVMCNVRKCQQSACGTEFILPIGCGHFLSSQCLTDTCAHGDALKHTHTALIYPVRHSNDTEVECSDAVLKIKARSSDISTIKSSFSYFPLCKYQLIFLLLNPGQAIVKYKSLTCILRDATNAVTSDCSHLVFKGLN